MSEKTPIAENKAVSSEARALAHSIEPSRETALLSAMADLQQEFNGFRVSATSRIARLERQTGREQSDSGFGFGFGDSIKAVVIAAVLIVAVQLAVQIWMQFRKEKEHGNVSLPQA